ncbi:MAG TPA: hypothetical protein PK867_01370, partial [Pirellulales bacterium]|nr:hypothetical protein [Pirellulales bacterium]
DDGWQALVEAILGAGFTVINSQPVKSEMSVATPKSAAKEPIAFDIIVVCRKQAVADTNPTRHRGAAPPTAISDALASARMKIAHLLAAGFRLSRNDRKIILYGQLLTTLAAALDAASFAAIVDAELAVEERRPTAATNGPDQQMLFERV